MTLDELANPTFKFCDGICPQIERFYQAHTYYGVLEGVPNRSINSEILNYDIVDAKRRFGLQYVFQFTPVERTRPDRTRDQYSGLPWVTCMIELSYHHPMKEKNLHWSRLGLIWYQESFAFPVDQEILDAVRLMSWVEYSFDDSDG